MEITNVVKIGTPSRPGLRFQTSVTLPNGRAYIDLFLECEPRNLKIENEGLILASVALKEAIVGG